MKIVFRNSRIIHKVSVGQLSGLSAVSQLHGNRAPSGRIDGHLCHLCRIERNGAAVITEATWAERIEGNPRMSLKD